MHACEARLGHLVPRASYGWESCAGQAACDVGRGLAGMHLLQPAVTCSRCYMFACMLLTAMDGCLQGWLGRAEQQLAAGSSSSSGAGGSAAAGAQRVSSMQWSSSLLAWTTAQYLTVCVACTHACALRPCALPHVLPAVVLPYSLACHGPNNTCPPPPGSPPSLVSRLRPF